MQHSKTPEEKNDFKLPGATLPGLRLITIPVSHYCEKARWALEWAGLEYQEDRQLPLLHRIANARFGGGSTVPVLVTATGEALTDSSTILSFADARVTLPARKLYPPEGSQARKEVLELETIFNRELGPSVRRIVYFSVLSHTDLILPMYRYGIPTTQRALAWPLLPFIRKAIRVVYKVNPESVARSQERLRAVFARVESTLARAPGASTGRYLVGESFTAADLTFASLAAPVLLPEGYGAHLPALADLPEALRTEVIALRATAAGRHATAMYSQHRRPL